MSASGAKPIHRDKVETWENDNWPADSAGYTTGWGIGHSEAAWYLRSLPHVRGVFTQIWGSNKLVSSFESFIAWRPWWLSADVSKTDYSWRPEPEPLHCDQSPYQRKGFHCIQGMIPLYDTNEMTGGLQVIPDSHSNLV
jgi:hypothetical protein